MSKKYINLQYIHKCIGDLSLLLNKPFPNDKNKTFNKLTNTLLSQNKYLTANNFKEMCIILSKEYKGYGFPSTVDFNSAKIKMQHNKNKYKTFPPVPEKLKPTQGDWEKTLKFIRRGCPKGEFDLYE